MAVTFFRICEEVKRDALRTCPMSSHGKVCVIKHSGILSNIALQKKIELHVRYFMARSVEG